ncbi:MAG: sulfotransferase [Steroidobacteraceae bacterium]
MNPEALLREAQLLDSEGRLHEAIGAYQQLLALRADLPDAWYNLAVLLRKTGQFSAALACYQHALNRGVAQPEEAHLNRGVIYSDCLHQPDAAEREILRALALNPTYVPALINLANLQEDQGRADDARATYEIILTLQPLNADALARYAGLHSFQDLGDPLIQRLKHIFAAPELSDAERATLGFSLGRALDSCHAYAAAFETYAAANRYSRASAPPGSAVYDRRAEERYIDRLIAAFPAPPGTVAAGDATGAATATATAPTTATATTAAATRGLTRPTPYPHPIFICGMFRSGSTLIEQVIADHTDVTPGGELEFLPNMVRTVLAPFPESVATRSPADLSSLAAQYLQALAGRFPGAPWVSDKRPDNFLYIGLIKRLFPTAKIVHTRRDPLDNCLSIFFLHLDPQMSYALDLAGIGHHYAQYRRLMQHWTALYPADIHDVDYDAYVHEPEAEARRLFEFLGLPGASRDRTSKPVRTVKTASVWQVREPLYQRSSGRARHYARELAALREYLAQSAFSS